jgi:hypothetical protein
MAIGQYGDNPYGDGLMAAPLGCKLVGTITRVSSTMFLAQRAQDYGGATNVERTYPLAKKRVQQSVGAELIEKRVSAENRPEVTYLYLYQPDCFQIGPDGGYGG